MERGAHQRRWSALAVSLLVHAGVVGLAMRPALPPSEPTARAALERTEVKWIETRELVTEPETPPTVRSKTSRPAPARRSGKPTTSAPATQPATSSGDDSPRAVALTPGLGALPLVDTSRAQEPTRGRTLHPSDLPTEQELLADEHERVLARVDGWTRRELAVARARGGLPDPAYGALGAALREATDHVPKFIDTNSPKEVVGALLESWGAGAEQYGKTGAPYAEPEGRLESVEKPSELARGASNGSPDAIATANFLAAGARLQEFADGRAGLELYALVEIKQQANGTLDSVELIRASGLRPFDAWVTERARTVGAGFSSDAGTKPLRSVWRFDGIITYRRKLKLSELNGRAAVGMIAMTALSALSSLGNTTPPIPGEPVRPLGPRMPAMSGRFDETTGELDMVDLTNPTYDCKVTLLEAD